jgi:tetratricopeptide (TPR) repeat protein
LGQLSPGAQPLRALPIIPTLALAVSPLAAQTVARHITAGNTARCQRNPQAALAHFTKALQLDSLNYEANWKAARELADIGKLIPDARHQQRDSVYAEALALAQRAVRVDSMGADGHYVAAVVVGRLALTQGPQERVRLARQVRDEALRAVQLDSANDGALHVLGRWNAEIMRLPDLLKFFAKAFLGASVFNAASWDSAIYYFNRASKIDPANVYHHLDLAEALVDAGRTDEAKPHLERVAQLPLGCDSGDPTYKQEAAALLQKITRR